MPLTLARGHGGWLRAAEAALCTPLAAVLGTPGNLQPGSTPVELLICCFTLGKFLVLSGLYLT